MNIVTIVGARPQFIKAAPISRCLRRCHKEILVHTGQHYDENMSNIFFDELNIPKPDYNLNVGSNTHGRQTGEMLAKIEAILMERRPDAVLVYGDTNSTLAGALAASKLLIPVYHIEAGLRSYNKRMPEEQNRVLTDHISSKLFCPTPTAVVNLRKEGIVDNVYNVGDVMYDAVLFNAEIAEKRSAILANLGLEAKSYILATIHRAENTDDPNRLGEIFDAMAVCGQTVVLPLHPRTRRYMVSYGLTPASNIITIDPVGYLDMLVLEKNAAKILTDSGGVQKEAYFMQVPCITVRDETEWIETVEDGWNVVAGADKGRIVEALLTFAPNGVQSKVFGDGHASERIVDLL